MQTKVCYSCGRPAGPRDFSCLHCGGDELGAEARIQPFDLHDPPDLSLPQPWHLLSWPPGAVGLISGEPGSGKSSLGGVLDPDGWLTSEQTPRAAAQALRRILGADGYRAIPVCAWSTLQELRGQIDSFGGGLLVIDSISELALDEQIEALAHIGEWALSNGGRVLVIAQVTKEGSTAGRQKLAHLVEFVTQVRVDEAGRRRLAALKNRHGGLFSVYFRLGSKGVQPLSLPYAYSVEGRSGNYRLAPYPSDRARWADWLEVVPLPIEGLASAAKRCERYASGWIVPGDVDERRAFAEAHGLTWSEPHPA